MFLFTTNKLDLAVIIFTCNVCTKLAVVPSQIWLCIFCLKQKLIFGYQKTVVKKCLKKSNSKPLTTKKGLRPKSSQIIEKARLKPIRIEIRTQKFEIFYFMTQERVYFLLRNQKKF